MLNYQRAVGYCDDSLLKSMARVSKSMAHYHLVEWCRLFSLPTANVNGGSTLIQ